MKLLKFLLSIAPTVLSAVIEIESGMKGAPGQTKKQAVMNAVMVAAKAGEDIPESHVQAISSFIDQSVSTFNQDGKFTHAPAPAAK